MKLAALMTAIFFAGTIHVANAQVPPEVEICRTAGLAALKKKNPDIDQLIFDTETLAISNADTKVEDTPVKMVIMGESYIREDRKDKPNRFVCLLGEKDKPLLTFFTQQ